ncbi:GNAT family N-acetyltransferase [Gordonia sp. ABSL49_1]|uniref:GNAT family N-acetyltransferase n=1 Tax=Gordonia sp. ABSL49_1 TaxID=2920941 RepID=UPI001F10FB0B|nr:GNAT family N-acetyltransferase [Gordonia sp. ABSL49_1]MCH5645596.1 GNAT family N-acetyltransferase [Gordonia sp. ABSL49_1]
MESTAHLSVEAVTDRSLADDVSAVAQVTFPLACPPHSTPEDIAGFLATNLRPNDFRGYIDDPDCDVLVARQEPGGPILGYSLVFHTEPQNPQVREVIATRPVSEVSKMYVLPDHHARGRAQSASRALMTAAIESARAHGSVQIWLGVNEENFRAQRFYTKMGFRRVGTKTFDLNGSIEHDHVMVHDLDV